MVDTMATFAFRIVSICGSTFLIDELVHRMTTSGFAAFSALAASSDTFTPRRLGRPTTSPRSRPTFAGVDVDGADDLEPGPRRDLLDDRRADRAEPEMHHADVRHKPANYTRTLATCAAAGSREPMVRSHTMTARSSRRPDARPCDLGVPAAARSRTGERGRDRPEARRLTHDRRAAASPDHVGRVPRQEPRLRAHQRSAPSSSRRSRRASGCSSICRITSSA